MDFESCAKIKNLLTQEMDHRSCFTVANKNLINAFSASNSCVVIQTKISVTTKDATYIIMTSSSPAYF